MWGCCAYQDNTNGIFNQIPTEKRTATLEDFNRIHQTLLTDIGSEWYLNNMHNTKPHTNKPRLSKKYE